MKFLHYTRKERLGIIFLVLLILLLMVLPDYFHLFLSPGPAPNADPAFLEAINQDSLLLSRGDNQVAHQAVRDQRGEEAKQLAVLKLNPRIFDPNALDAEGWLALGLSPGLVRTIMHYRAKGGNFRKPEDLRRIYGLEENTFSKLAPWVRIKDQYDKGSWNYTERIYNKNKPPHPVFGAISALPIDINEADSSEWVGLRGIGPALARRIIRFREKLGGFYSVEQVAETYGLSDSVFTAIRPRLQCGALRLKKIRINSDSLQTLEQHPYIGRAVARQLFNYRRQHGDFGGLESLADVEALPASWITKTGPYIDFK